MLSVDLITAYIFRPYTFFLRQNSSLLVKNVLKEVDYSINYISSLFLILKEIQLILFIIIFLLIIEPQVTLYGFSVIFLISFLFFRLSRRKLKIVGIKRIKALEDLFRVSFEIFGAIKEIKIYNKFNFFINKFKFAKVSFEKNVFISDYIKKLPRVFFELFSVFFIVFLILMFHFTGRNLLSVIPFLSLVVVVIIRLMPSFSSLAAAFTYITIYKNSFDEVINEIYQFKSNETKHKDEANKLNSETMQNEKNLISLKNISFSYPLIKKGTTSISNINLDIEKGAMVGILGKSGSGKSTLINIILKLINPHNGQVKFNFDSLKKNNYFPVSFVPQDIYLMDDTLKKNIAFGVDPDLIDENKVIECLKDTEMWDYVKSYDSGLEQKVGERGIRLSGGEKQRIGLARALYKNPEILILDEATSSLDNLTERKIVDSIKKLKKKLTIVIIAHRLSTLKDCDKIFYLENGAIKDSGLLNELLQRNKELN